MLQCEDFEKFLKCADAAGQHNESVSAFLHELLALAHGFRIEKFTAVVLQDTGLVKKFRGDPQTVAACGDHAAHCGTHQSLRAAAEDQTEVFLNHGAAERLDRREIAFIDIRAACPINANIHESKILSEDDRKIIADTAKKRKG